MYRDFLRLLTLVRMRSAVQIRPAAPEKPCNHCGCRVLSFFQKEEKRPFPNLWLLSGYYIQKVKSKVYRISEADSGLFAGIYRQTARSRADIRSRCSTGSKRPQHCGSGTPGSSGCSASLRLEQFHLPYPPEKEQQLCHHVLRNESALMPRELDKRMLRLQNECKICGITIGDRYLDPLHTLQVIQMSPGQQIGLRYDAPDPGQRPPQGPEGVARRRNTVFRCLRCKKMLI